ncbi:MAG: N-acetylglucosamine-6-phosphate deacetylase [Actinobacteria bacterium]|nr:N-acetylglucosamine-6-phosphate deacetylase [Actinomycetota bacterium]
MIKVKEKFEKTAIVNGVLITPLKVLKNKILLIEKKIISIEEGNLELIKEKLNIIDAEGSYVVPGFIDLHVHGGGGADVMDGTPGSLEKVAKIHCFSGTTSFLPTTMTMNKDKIIKSLENIKKVFQKGTGTSEIIGIHLEGPYINPKRKGAQKESDILKPSIKGFEEFNDISEGLIKMVTIAPEIPGAIDFIKYLYKNGIYSSAGHSYASYEQTLKAVKVGLSQITHIFNAMKMLHHREPGLVGAALTTEELYAQVIADGFHVHPAVIKILVKAKSLDKIILITDAMRATSLGEGITELGGQKVVIKNSQARLEDGTLAGSIITMDKAIRIMVREVSVPLKNAIQMATLNPAKSIGIQNNKGSLEPGKDADIVIMGGNLEIETVIAKSKIVFRKNSFK